MSGAVIIIDPRVNTVEYEVKVKFPWATPTPSEAEIVAVLEEAITNVQTGAYTVSS